jgi:hypothetical protein
MFKSSHRPQGKLMGDSRFARCLQGGGVYVQGGTVAISSCTISGNGAYSVRAPVQYFPSLPWETHVYSLFTGRRCLCGGWHGDLLIVHHKWELRWQCARSRSKVPIAPMGKLLTHSLRLACTTAADAPVNYSVVPDAYVPQRPEIFHRPDEKIADVLASIHACTTVNTSVNYRLCVPQRP